MDGKKSWKIEYELADIAEVAKSLLEMSKIPNFLFSGPMGAGKTTLIASLVSHLGSLDAASSPTFGWVNTYQDPAGRTVAIHFDNYRIEDPASVHAEELWEYYELGIPVLMEWPEKLTVSLWPDEYHWIEISLVSAKRRLLRFYDNSPASNLSPSLP